MARSGFSASNFQRCSSAVVSAVPLTMACWAKTSVTGTGQQMMGLFNSASATARNQFCLRIGSSNNVVARTSGASTAGSANGTGSFTSGVWFHAAGVFSATNSRTSYRDGGNKVTETTSETPSGLNRTSIGLEDNAAADEPFGGQLGEAAIWNVALSDADILMLSKGFSPLLMHPESLIAYWPLIGNNSPENNLKSNSATMSIVGSLSKAAHPRIFMPGRKRLAA